MTLTLTQEEAGIYTILFQSPEGEPMLQVRGYVENLHTLVKAGADHLKGNPTPTTFPKIHLN